MRNILLVALLLIFISGCDDEVEDKYGDYVTGESSPKNTSAKGGSSVAGLYFDMDSVTRYVITKYNERLINDIACKTVESLLKKHKVLEYENSLTRKYGYEFSRDVKDTLTYYNYSSNDMGSSGDDKDITLYGTSPYKEKNIWEGMIVKATDLDTKHPLLFKKANAVFFKNFHPTMTDITVENQAGNNIEYNGKIAFNNGSEQYVHFTVTNKNNSLTIGVTSLQPAE